MATYNLNYSTLETYLDRKFSEGTENAIIEAIKSANLIGSGHGKIGVDIESASGNYTVPTLDKLFLDVGQHNTMHVTTGGGTIVASGDGSVKIFDQGPGGDTLVGGHGVQMLSVAHGNNLVMSGGGTDTLAGGAGHDTLVGGGHSVLQAGSGGSTLIGGLSEHADIRGANHRPIFDDEHHGHGNRGHEGHRGDDRDERWHGHNDDHGGGGMKSPLLMPTMSADTLKGGAGNDLIQVSHGNNLLISGGGADTIRGGDGHDTIYGGGTDTINVNWGDAVVYGGKGTDLVNVGLHGNDTIYGGTATTVHLDQSSTAIKHQAEVNGVTTITFNDHQVLTLSKVTIEFANGVHKSV